jgi:cytochrome P450
MTETIAREDAAPRSYPMRRDEGCPFAPPADYQELRETSPISRVRLYDGREAWLFTRYDDIRAVLSHPDVSAETVNPDFPFLTPGDKVSKLVQSFQRWDDPRHADRRRMLMPHFTIKRIQGMRPRVQGMIDTIYDRMVEAGPPLDFVENMALALPSTVACDLLGVDYDNHEFFESRFAVRLDRRSSAEEVQAANAEVRRFVDDVVRSKYGAGKPDLIGQFVTQHVETGEVSHEDAVTDAVLLLLAGHETTANMIALGTLVLLQHPDEVARLQADPALVPNAVEELLRYLTISQSMGVRIAAADLEIAGQRIARGDGLIVPVAAGNWDDSVFECPERFDIDRSEARSHITFGFGPHVCLGQPLARMELREVFSSLFERFPDLRLAIPFSEVRFKFDAVFYGLYDLPVTWDAEAARRAGSRSATDTPQEATA